MRNIIKLVLGAQFRRNIGVAERLSSGIRGAASLDLAEVSISQVVVMLVGYTNSKHRFK